jgi:hypothetical protein
MSNDVIISVEGLGKRYRISHQGERQRYVALRDVIAQKAKQLFSRGQKSAVRSQTSDLRPPSSTPSATSDLRKVFRRLLGLARRFLRGQTRGGGGHH